MKKKTQTQPLAWATSIWGNKAHIVLGPGGAVTFCGRPIDREIWGFSPYQPGKPSCQVCVGVADKAGYL